MFVKSLQVGKSVVREYQDMKVETACFKLPVEGALHLGREGFIGDQQADKVNHGGPDKAVLVYPFEHYSHWENFLGREPGVAALGENLGRGYRGVCLHRRHLQSRRRARTSLTASHSLFQDERAPGACRCPEGNDSDRLHWLLSQSAGRRGYSGR